eukprot:CAMPEP_0117545942 /NCGR_PEP_ID=MMETSP0784-20121206/46354_1 /TAXON_ID=39447 /ORGANISM="" /LENGTH=178 /DNA_ID=CAMNT_0005342803 /DNA_START=221 /DNA_END=757 /DNA_ORIENTATION=+
MAAVVVAPIFSSSWLPHAFMAMPTVGPGIASSSCGPSLRCMEVTRPPRAAHATLRRAGGVVGGASELLKLMKEVYEEAGYSRDVNDAENGGIIAGPNGMPVLHRALTQTRLLEEPDLDAAETGSVLQVGQLFTVKEWRGVAVKGTGMVFFIKVAGEQPGWLRAEFAEELQGGMTELFD